MMSTVVVAEWVGGGPFDGEQFAMPELWSHVDILTFGPDGDQRVFACPVRLIGRGYRILWNERRPVP
jgi:hypothetical protein